MNGYLTPARFNRVLDIPIVFAQTELRRGKYIQIAQMPVDLNQQLHVRGLVIHCVKNLTPGAVPVYATTSLGAVSVGVYFGTVLTSPLALTYVFNLGISSINPFHIVKCLSPGVYTAIISNNTTNMDFSVAATGVAKLYL